MDLKQGTHKSYLTQFTKYLTLIWLKGIYCPIIRKRGRGGIKPVPLEYFGEENLYLKKFSLLLGKNLAFFEFFEKIIA